jgi:signal peptide peptidase SppA
MRIEDFSPGTAWAIAPDAFELLSSRFAALREEDNFSSQAAAYTQPPPDPDERLYETVDGVARIPIVGYITRRTGFLSTIFGATGLDTLSRAIDAAVSDRSVAAIELMVDSPGGTASGLIGVADLIFAARSEKPVVAYASGTMASAAYWIGSAAHKIVVEPSTQIGSIGVLLTHTDFSAMDARIGIKTTYLTAGHYKALGNNSEPLSDEARAYFQTQLDYLYGLFVGAVARHRGADPGVVLQNMADGRVFIGAQAVAAGLADYVGTEKDAVTLLKTGSLPTASKKVEPVVTAGLFDRLVEKHLCQNPAAKKSTAMQAVAATHPEAYAAWLLSKQPPKTATMAAVAAQDIGRNSGHQGQFEVLVESHLAANPGTAKSTAMLAVRKDHPEAYNEWMRAQQNRTPAPTPPSGSSRGGDFEALLKARLAARPGSKKSEAMAAIRKDHPEAYGTWLQSQQR